MSAALQSGKMMRENKSTAAVVRFPNEESCCRRRQWHLSRRRRAEANGNGRTAVAQGR